MLVIHISLRQRFTVALFAIAGIPSVLAIVANFDSVEWLTYPMRCRRVLMSACDLAIFLGGIA